MSTEERIKVLIVDDDPDDISLTQEVMEMSKLKLDLCVAGDGIKALEFLNETLKSNKKLPDLILLDLNMPRMNGHEFMDKFKKDVRLKKIPVVILSTSEADKDILKSYGLGASCFVTKPVGLTEFQKVVKSINNFWFTVVKFPESK